MGYYPLPLLPLLSLWLPTATVDTGVAMTTSITISWFKCYMEPQFYYMIWSIRDFLSTFVDSAKRSTRKIGQKRRSFLKVTKIAKGAVSCEVNSCSKSSYWANKISIVNWKYHTSSTSKELCFVLFLVAPHLKNNVSAAMERVCHCATDVQNITGVHTFLNIKLPNASTLDSWQ